VERTARPAKAAHLATAALLKAIVVKMVTATQDVNPSSVLATLKLMFLPMASAAKMERPARAAHLVTAVQPRATVARTATAMQDASPSLVLATLRPTSLLMVSVARMERPARAAHLETAALLKVTVERTVTAAQAAKLHLVLARPTPARSPPTADAEPSTARPAREAHSATAVRLPRATVAKTITVTLVARVPLEPATPALALSLPMETVVRTERLARVAPLETAVLSTDIVARVMISAALDASWPLDCAPVSQPIQSVAQGTARLVLGLALETAARRMDTVEALLLTVVRDGKLTLSMSLISLLTLFLQSKGRL
jgi:hypothetical protein